MRCKPKAVVSKTLSKMADNRAEENSNSDDDSDDVSALDDLNEDQRQTLVQFQEITAIDDLRICRQKLNAYNWNLESAVHDALNESEGFPTVYNQEDPQDEPVDVDIDVPIDNNFMAQSQSSVSSSSGSVGVHASAIDVQRRTTWFQWLMGWIMMPYRFTYSVVSDLVTFLIRIIWPSFNRSRSDPVEDIIEFKRKFEEQYGTWHPTMYQGTYSQVLSDAKKELRFLLVYLHSGDHQDTPKFCKDVLCNSGFKDYVNGNMLFWACDVNSYEGHRVSRAMRETTYPFLAVVCLRDGRMSIVWRIEGYMEVDKLIALFARIIDENEPTLIAARAERAERSQANSLRQEQDAAYMESLKADQEKERKKREEEDMKRREELKRQEKELEKQRKIEDIVSRKEECRRRLEECPEPCRTDPEALRIRLKLPDGTQLDRFFLKSNRLKMLYDFVFSHDKAPNEFVISSNFPRKTYHLDRDSMVTLQDVGLTSSAALFVQDISEDSSDDEE